MNVLSFLQLKDTKILEIEANRLVVENLKTLELNLLEREVGKIEEYYINVANLNELRGADHYIVGKDGTKPVKDKIEVKSFPNENFLFLSNEPYHPLGLTIEIENSELLRQFIGRDIPYVRPQLADPLSPMYPGFANYLVLSVEDKDEYNTILIPEMKNITIIKKGDKTIISPGYSIKAQMCLSNHFVVGYVESLPDDINELTAEQVEELRFIQDQYPIDIFDQDALKKANSEIYERIYESTDPVPLPPNYIPVYGKTWEDTILKISI